MPQSPSATAGGFPPIMEIAREADRRYIARLGGNPAAYSDAQILEAEVGWVEDVRTMLQPYLYDPLTAVICLALSAGVAFGRSQLALLRQQGG